MDRIHLVFAILACGCYSTGNGPEPPSQALYFPTSAVASPSGRALYVANSDFDLQYNGGMVQALDLGRLRALIDPLRDPATSGAPDVCARARLGPNPSPVIYPGPCGPLDVLAPPDGAGPLVASAAKIGAFATSLLLVCRPEAGRPGTGARCDGDHPTQARLFAAVRGDPSLTYFDVDDDRGGGAEAFRLECGQAANDGRCDAAHRLGTNAGDNTRGLTLPAEPYEIAVSDGAEAIVVTHQTSGAVSLFASVGDDVFQTIPAIQFVLTGLPTGAFGIAPLPIPAIARPSSPDTSGTSPNVLMGGYRPGFVVGYRDTAEIDIVRFYGDRSSSPSRSYLALARTAALPILANASGSDSRGIAIDRGPRDACERSCGDAACLLDCTRIPLPVYVANRTPPTLLIGETRTSATSQGSGATASASGYNEAITLLDAMPLAAGPSRVVLGTIRDREGQPRTRVFVVCFDQRAVIVYDPERRQVESQIRTGRGPQAIVIDPVTPLAYVVHFADSYIGVLDLDQSHGLTFETMIATVGVPQPPQVSK